MERTNLKQWTVRQERMLTALNDLTSVITDVNLRHKTMDILSRKQSWYASLLVCKSVRGEDNSFALSIHYDPRYEPRRRRRSLISMRGVSRGAYSPAKAKLPFSSSPITSYVFTVPIFVLPEQFVRCISSRQSPFRSRFKFPPPSCLPWKT